MRKSYVCKQLFDVSLTVRDFGRETVDERRSLFDNYRVTHLKNVVKSSAIRNAFNWPLSTSDLNLSSLFGSDCARRADCHICQSADRVATEKHLEGVLCTNSDLKIVTIFWDTQNLFRETMNLLWETMNLLRQTVNLLRETTITTRNFVYNKIFGRNHSVDRSVVQSNVNAKFSRVAGFMKAVPGSVQYNAAVDSDTKVHNNVFKLSEV